MKKSNTIIDGDEINIIKQIQVDIENDMKNKNIINNIEGQQKQYTGQLGSALSMMVFSIMLLIKGIAAIFQEDFIRGIQLFFGLILFLISLLLTHYLTGKNFYLLSKKQNKIFFILIIAYNIVIMENFITFEVNEEVWSLILLIILNSKIIKLVKIKLYFIMLSFIIITYILLRYSFYMGWSPYRFLLSFLQLTLCQYFQYIKYAQQYFQKKVVTEFTQAQILDRMKLVQQKLINCIPIGVTLVTIQQNVVFLNQSILYMLKCKDFDLVKRILNLPVTGVNLDIDFNSLQVKPRKSVKHFTEADNHSSIQPEDIKSIMQNKDASLIQNNKDDQANFNKRQSFVQFKTENLKLASTSQQTQFKVKYFYDQMVQKIQSKNTTVEGFTPDQTKLPITALQNIPNTIELNVQLNNNIFRIKLMIYEIIQEQQNILDSEDDEDNDILESNKPADKTLLNKVENQKFILITLQDISMEVKIKSLEEKKQNIMKLLNRITHDFKGPLNCSINMLELLKGNMTEQDKTLTNSFIEPALSSNYLLLHQIDNILDMSRLENKEFVLLFEKFNIFQLVFYCRNLFKNQLQTRKLYMNIEIEKNVPQYISQDPHRIKQTLISLLLNSLKHTDTGGIRVNVSCQQHPLIKFTITDTGTGFTKTQQKQLRQNIGNRLSITNPKNYDQGIQIDLAMSCKLALKLSGDQHELHCQFTQDSGSTYVFFVQDKAPASAQNSKIKQDKPSVKFADNDSLSIESAKQDSKKDNELQLSNSKLRSQSLSNAIEPSNVIEGNIEPSPKKKLDCSLLQSIKQDTIYSKTNTLGSQYYYDKSKDLQDQLVQQNECRNCSCSQILIVDDDEFSILVLQALLDKYLITTEYAMSGDEAVKIVQNRMQSNLCCNQFCLIFMDIEMPKKNGFITTQEIIDFCNQEQKPPPLISACTVYLQEDQKKSAKKSGMEFYLTKPIDKKQLETILKLVFFGLNENIKTDAKLQLLTEMSKQYSNKFQEQEISGDEKEKSQSVDSDDNNIVSGQSDERKIQ